MHDQEQQEHLERVADKIADAIIAFARERMTVIPPTFNMGELTRKVAAQFAVAPDSPGRILRALRKERKLDYRVLSRKLSLYEFTAVAP